MKQNVSGPKSKGEAAKLALIQAGLRQFGEFGLQATTREIAADAGQNIAAIAYYFESKEALYIECARYVARCLRRELDPYLERAERVFQHDPVDRDDIRCMIYDACYQSISILTSDQTLDMSKFISREQLSPTEAYQVLHEHVIEPMHIMFTSLIGAYAAQDPKSTEMILHAHAIIGEIIAFRFARETLFRRTGWKALDRQHVDFIYGVIKLHLDSILQSFELKGEPNNE